MTIRGGRQMAITYNKDKRSGITYAYETTYTWNKELKQSRSKRTLIGRVDEATGKIIPTDGRCKKRSPSYVAKETDTLSCNVKELQDMVARLQEENAILREENDMLKARLV